MYLRWHFEVDSVCRASRPDGLRRVHVLRDHLSRMRGKLRSARRDARWPDDQARGQPGAPAQQGRALRARAVGAPGAIQPGSPPRSDGEGRRRLEGDVVGQRPCAPQPEARRGKEPRDRRQWGVPEPARDGQLPGIPRCVARRIRHASAPECGLRGRQRCDRGQSPYVWRVVAEALLLRREAHHLVRRRLPRDVGHVGSAAARLRRRPRKDCRGSPLRVHRRPSLPHRPERGPVDRLQAG
jgi:hypothetical protein